MAKLPQTVNDLHDEPTPSRRTTARIVFALATAAFFYSTYRTPSTPTSPSNLAWLSKSTDPIEGRKLWAHNTPYFPLAAYQPIPSNCELTQAIILQRHGAREAEPKELPAIKGAIERLQNATTHYDPRLTFLRDYTWDLGDNSELLPFGALESSTAGAIHHERYGHLVTPDRQPFVRTAASSRVYDSATNWTAGFSQGRYIPEAPLSLPERENTTLASHMCPAARGTGEERNHWRKLFATPIRERLRAAAPGARVKRKDVVWLLALCPLDELAKGTTSPFCDMFTRAEFEGLEYYEDLEKYYSFGYGQSLGRVQGVGYVNELLARLTRTPVRDNTQTNRTLDASPATFPLDRTVYADFAHASVMIAIYGTLGLFPQEHNLDPSWADPQRSFVLAKMVPYAARLVTEKMECRGAPGSAGEGVERAEYARIMVNDAVQPLNCGGVDGICELQKFVESMWYARSDGDGDWDRCWEGQEPVKN
ncbi:hypothetical protein HWV62_8341 [Athelia sp. TMB]|nr:hypothetical protein HWV62_8341 [Athelia sp. TMB]